MQMQNRKRQRFTMYAIFALVYIMSALYAMSYFFQNSALGDDYSWATRFEAMVDGTARKPFVYRQLVPVLTNAVVDVTPPAFRTSAAQWVEHIKTDNRYKNLRRYTPWLQKTFPARERHYKRMVASVIIFGFLLGYMALLFVLARALFPADAAIAFFAPVVGVLAFCSFGYQWQYIYDIPLLCLSAACFYLIYKERFRGYLLVFLLACLNKETAIFSLIFFTIWHVHRLPARHFAVLWALQCAIYMSVKLIVSINFIKNGGYFLEDNIHLILAKDILAESNVQKIVITLSLWFLLAFGWQDKPAFLKQALWLLPMVYAAYFLYGFPHEYRVFFDIHPPLVLLATHTLIVGTGIAQSPVFSKFLRKKEQTA